MSTKIKAALAGCAAVAFVAGTALAGDDDDHRGSSRGVRVTSRSGHSDGVRKWVEPSRSWGVGAGFNKVVTPRPVTVCPPPVRVCPPPVRHVPVHVTPRCDDRPRVRVGGTYVSSGFSIGGVYRDDNFSIGVRVGDVFRGRRDYDDCRPSTYCPPTPTYCPPKVVYTPTYYEPTYVRTYYNEPATVVVQQPTVVTQPVVVQQPEVVRVLPLPPQQGLGGATSLEAGTAAAMAGDYSQAVTHLRAHVREHPEDARAARLLAISLLADGRPDDAASVLRGAYRQDARLAVEPLVPADAGLGTREVRDLVSRAVLQANRDQSASSWLVVAVLMQSEGRGELARAMLERSKAQGLEATIAEALGPELR
jgi:hypothetical protein